MPAVDGCDSAITAVSNPDARSRQASRAKDAPSKSRTGIARGAMSIRRGFNGSRAGDACDFLLLVTRHTRRLSGSMNDERGMALACPLDWALSRTRLLGRMSATARQGRAPTHELGDGGWLTLSAMLPLPLSVATAATSNSVTHQTWQAHAGQWLAAVPCEQSSLFFCEKARGGLPACSQRAS